MSATDRKPAMLPPSLDPERVQVGDSLPPLDIPLTRTSIIAAALATRDWQDVHHDHERAQASGLKDILVSIPATTAYVTRFVTSWGGPRSVLKSCKVKLGASAFPGDTLHLTGSVTARNANEVEVEYKAATASGVHASGRVVLALDAGKHK